MNALTASYGEREVIGISNELKKLFALQDRHLSEDKTAFLIQEFQARGYFPGAIIAGVRKLMDEDLKVVKLHTILDASRPFMRHDEKDYAACDFCDSTGAILMMRDDGYEMAFACRCDKGLDFSRRHKVFIWNKKAVQEERASSGKRHGYALRFPDILQAKEMVSIREGA